MAVSARAVYRFVRTAGRELCEVSKKMRWDWTLKASGWGCWWGGGVGWEGRGSLLRTLRVKFWPGVREKSTVRELKIAGSVSSSHR